MGQPANPLKIARAVRESTTSSAPQIADAVTTPKTAGESSAAGAASPARASSPALLLSVLPGGALTYKIQPTRFEAIAAETLNNAGTQDDGFETMITPVLAAFGEDQPGLASMSAGLSDAEFVDGAFTADVHAPIAADIADLVSSGDAAVGNVAAAFGSAPAGGVQPAPAPDTPSPDDGGGGGGKDITGGNDGSIGWTDWGDLFQDNMSA